MTWIIGILNSAMAYYQALDRDRSIAGARLSSEKERNLSMNDIHPAPAEFTAEEVKADPILQFFHYSHLPEALQARSKPFCDLARHVINGTPRNAERSVALRKLLEAKDAAVRAGVPPLA